MNQPARFIFIRSRQISREFTSLGIFYSLIIAIAAFLLFYITYVSASTFKGVATIAVLFFLSLFSLHYNRNDREFIEGNTDNPQLIYFLEYSVLATTFIILFIIQLKSFVPLLLYVPAFILSHIKLHSKRKLFNSVSLSFIDIKNYEWLSGLRKTGWLIFILIAGALIVTPVVFAPMIILWFALFVISSFYDQHESLDMVESFELSAKKFLIRKIGIHTGLVLIPYSIILSVGLLFHPEKWWVYLMFLLYAVLMIMVFIVTKYSYWGVAGEHKAGNVTNSLCLIGFFIPFLLPMPLIILAINYSKSIRKLAPVLNDYN